jgi:cytochrome P450
MPNRLKMEDTHIMNAIPETTGTEASALEASNAVAPPDHRKSAKFAAANISPFAGARITKGFAGGREILRSSECRQAGGAAARLVIDNPDHVSFFFLDGDEHRKRRASVAGYFTPKAIITRYHPIINETMDELISDMQASGTGVLDEMALVVAAKVTAEILGLEYGDDPLGMARRLHSIRRTTDKTEGDRLRDEFYDLHIAPAIEIRRNAPKDDVISYMTRENYSKPAMMMECSTYGTAGVSTTREFIGMTAWHLFDRPELKQQFLNANEEGQFAILQEILRLDPVTGFLYRRAEVDIPDAKEGPIKAGDVMAINIRSANLDPETVGECPVSFDADRAAKTRNMPSYLSFGDGPHRCPGSQVALHETRMFLDRLMRVPGIRLEKEPVMQWANNTQSYEIREAVVACDTIG